MCGGKMKQNAEGLDFSCNVINMTNVGITGFNCRGIERKKMNETLKKMKC